MGRDREEPNRVLGFPVRRAISGPPPERAPRGGDPPTRPDEEPQRVLGFGVGWFRLDGGGILARLVERIGEFRQRERRS